MKKQELQDQIDSLIKKDNSVTPKMLLDNYLKNEAFIHIKELTYTVKNKEKSQAVYKELQKVLPEIHLELCPKCNNIINYYKKEKHNYEFCPRCKEEIDEDPIKTSILINFKFLSTDNKLLLLEDIKTKIKIFDLKESIAEILGVSDDVIVEFYNKNT